MRPTAIVELTVGSHGIDEARLQRALTIAINNAVGEALAYYRELIGTEVVATHILEQDQTIQFVPAAAAAAAAEGEED